MHFHDLVFIAVGLAMDAFAVAVAMGATLRKQFKFSQMLLVGLWFGGFQAVMPLIGWWGGGLCGRLVNNHGPWISCLLLTFIGGKMIWEAFKRGDHEEIGDFCLYHLTALAFATSIDALIVGVSFACLKEAIGLPVIVIGLVTAFLSIVGCIAGKLFGHIFENKFEFAGGIVLILLGFKILIFH